MSVGVAWEEAASNYSHIAESVQYWATAAGEHDEDGHSLGNRELRDLKHSNRLLPDTRYVAVHGMEGSNNRRQALTMAVITAALLNRTLLVCDPPLLELYDVDAILERVPVQATVRCRGWEPRPRSRVAACKYSPACNPRHWTTIESLGGPDRLDPGKLVATWGDAAAAAAAATTTTTTTTGEATTTTTTTTATAAATAHVLVAQDYWGVPWWNFNLLSSGGDGGGGGSPVATPARLEDLHRHVRYAPAVFDAAEKIVRAILFEHKGRGATAEGRGATAHPLVGWRHDLRLCLHLEEPISPSD